MDRQKGNNQTKKADTQTNKHAYIHTFIHTNEERKKQTRSLENEDRKKLRRGDRREVRRKNAPEE